MRIDSEIQAAPIHVLAPGSRFLDVYRAFLITFDVLALTKTRLATTMT
jgi:hypothetical protein